MECMESVPGARQGRVGSGVAGLQVMTSLDQKTVCQGRTLSVYGMPCVCRMKRLGHTQSSCGLQELLGFDLRAE